MNKNKFNELRLAFFARVLLIIGGLNYLYMGLVSKSGFLFFDLSKNVLNTIFVIIGISALYLFFNRNYYLPFLGETVIPTITPFKKNSKNVITTIIKNMPPKSTIIYWAAKPNQNNQLITDPYSAYGDYTNSGVTLANELGEAQIEYECPSAYQVPKFGVFKKSLQKHIHYRYIDPKFPGLVSPVYTLFLNVECK